MLQIQDVSCENGGDVLFTGFTFSLDSRSRKRVAVVWRNGCGKTTLLKAIARINTPYSGVISTKDEVIGYLEQDPTFLDESLTIAAYLSEDLEEEWMFYQVEQAICEVGLDLTDQDLTISCLSGGQKMRVRLAKILMQEPTVLLFDEPTNHVDDMGKKFLASFMKNFSGSIFFVTHDRKFIAEVTNMIIEITPEQRVEAYTGSYEEYLITRKDRFDRQMTIYEKQYKEINEIEMWLKENEFHPKFRFSDRVMSQKKTLEKLKSAAIPKPIRDPEIAYNMTFPKSEGTVLTVKNLSMAFENKELFQNLSFVLHGTERIFVGGPNGSGKSTLLRILLGKQDGYEGLVNLRQNAKIGYLSQFSKLDPKHTVHEAFQFHTNVNITEEQAILAKFLFDSQKIKTSVGNLSYGEIRRLELAILLANKPNMLILDEPTNHLDIFLREQLEDILITLPIPMIIVSHDEYFVEKMKCTQILDLE